ncbi:MAG: putative transrane protein of unknown function [Chitinophagaceae bacterium]|nr:putative transrane protein of unknown function [Chitinophagaceae bacterium]
MFPDSFCILYVINLVFNSLMWFAMKSKQFISTYFKSEQIESLLLLAIGMIALTEALYFVWGVNFSAFYKGMSWPLLLIAIAEIAFGASIYFRSLLDIRKVEAYYGNDPSKLQTEELPRMKKLMRNYVIYRWAQSILCIVGVFMIIGMNSTSDFWMGVGTGLWFQSGVMLVSDFFAERRGAVYIQGLEEMNQ